MVRWVIAALLQLVLINLRGQGCTDQHWRHSPIQGPLDMFQSCSMSLSNDSTRFYSGHLLGTWTTTTDAGQDVLAIRVDKFGTLIMSLYRHKGNGWQWMVTRVVSDVGVFSGEYFFELDFGINPFGGSLFHGGDGMPRHVPWFYSLDGDTLEVRSFSSKYINSKHKSVGLNHDPCQFATEQQYQDFVLANFRTDSLWTTRFRFCRYNQPFLHYDEQADLYYGNRFSSDDARAVLGLGILTFFSAAMLSSDLIPATTSTSNSNRGVLLGYDKDREAIYSGGLRSEMDIRYDIYMNPK